MVVFPLLLKSCLHMLLLVWRQSVGMSGGWTKDGQDMVYDVFFFNKIIKIHTLYIVQQCNVPITKKKKCRSFLVRPILQCGPMIQTMDFHHLLYTWSKILTEIPQEVSSYPHGSLTFQMKHRMNMNSLCGHFVVLQWLLLSPMFEVSEWIFMCFRSGSCRFSVTN